MSEFRLLKAHEINARVNKIFDKDDWKGVSILLYKDARVDMAILDEVYGPTNWRVKYEAIGVQMFCTIDIWDNEKKQWIAKQSNGTESQTEAEKGQASDAFKRAGFMVGIGRELYSAPDIMVTLSPSEIDTTSKGKTYCKPSFFVSEIEYDENRYISHVVIGKKNRDIVVTDNCFEWPKASARSTAKKPEPEKTDKKPPIVQSGIFDYRVCWNDVVERCGGDSVKTAQLFKEHGAGMKLAITQAIYEAVIKDM